METPMQEYINWLDEMTAKGLGLSNVARQKAESFLEKEKQVIIEAWNNANEDGISCVDSNAEQYYKETFN